MSDTLETFYLFLCMLFIVKILYGLKMREREIEKERERERERERETERERVKKKDDMILRNKTKYKPIFPGRSHEKGIIHARKILMS